MRRTVNLPRRLRWKKRAGFDLDGELHPPPSRSHPRRLSTMPLASRRGKLLRCAVIVAGRQEEYAEAEGEPLHRRVQPGWAHGAVPVWVGGSGGGCCSGRWAPVAAGAGGRGRAGGRIEEKTWRRILPANGYGSASIELGQQTRLVPI